MPASLNISEQAALFDRFPEPERTARRALARNCLHRIENQIRTASPPPRGSLVSWAVDEINELAAFIDRPGTPDAEYEADLLVDEIAERLHTESSPERPDPAVEAGVSSRS